ncbi:MAG TPA: FlgD immunoglobulin-like domain containing protein [Candidatus Limnocylindrales bacterium]|nr:FlgD immunoglobulin-like domain containing protein [Candidatus Limnocylindrales bacterium]
MRKLAAAVAFALVTVASMAAPVAAVQTSSAKVVIIVGATHGMTATYRSRADEAYAEAIKYTPKVTKVYSPNATWTKVKAATTGANIVIYFGHGNGWPSPYTYDPAYTTKDGFGLNADLNGDGKLSDYENKYYGEPSMAQLGLAPNAIVMLHHLCYASGNSEPGGAAPTVSVARQRIDNYAAGFLKGNAEAVLADGHMGPAAYLRAMFTTNRSIVDVWRTAPNVNNHETAFASTRTPGYTAYSDPDTATTGYYRSLVTKPSLTTTAITKAVGDTGADPAALVVPGRASVEVPEAPLYSTAAGAGADTTATDATLLTLPDGTRLKTLAIAAPATVESAAVVQVEGLDDPSINGYISAADLAPRDSRAPVLIGMDSGAGRFSPNGDGRSDDQPISGMFSETVAWTLEIKNGAGDVVETAAGSGSTFNVTWDGLVDGSAVPDGTYTWTARGTDAWQNGAATGGGTIVVDTVGPDVTGLSPDGSSVTTFTPNGDGVSDTVATAVAVPEAGTVSVRVTDSTNATVRSWTATSVAGSNAISWDGRNNSGAYVADGTYTLGFSARDAAGNGGAGRTRDVRVIRFLSAVKTSLKAFYPHDADRLSPTTTLSFTLARPAIVTWTVRNAAGAVVLTKLNSEAVAAGVRSWVWDGRNADGVLLPRGIYTSSVTATDGDLSISHAVKVEMNAFAIVTSTATARRGSSLTVTATSAEALSTTPRLYITQPGFSTWAVTMTRLDSRTFRVTITPKKGAAAGTLSLKVWARDYDGRSQATIRKLPLS